MASSCTDSSTKCSVTMTFLTITTRYSIRRLDTRTHTCTRPCQRSLTMIRSLTSIGLRMRTSTCSNKSEALVSWSIRVRRSRLKSLPLQRNRKLLQPKQRRKSQRRLKPSQQSILKSQLPRRKQRKRPLLLQKLNQLRYLHQLSQYLRKLRKILHSQLLHSQLLHSQLLQSQLLQSQPLHNQPLQSQPLRSLLLSRQLLSKKKMRFQCT